MKSTQSQPPAAGEAAHKFFDIVNGSQGWDVRESDGLGSPWVVVATCVEFGQAQKLKSRLSACNSHAALVAALEESLAALKLAESYIRYRTENPLSGVNTGSARADLEINRDAQRAARAALKSATQ